MSKHDDPALVRTALLQRLKVHTRVAQQGLGPTPDVRKKLAASLPDIFAFGDRRYAAAHVVLDWDHRLPSEALLLRLYLSLHRPRGGRRGERPQGPRPRD